MAKAIYMGIGGVARKVKQPYIGVGNVARKVKTGYVGIGGVARKFYPAITWNKYTVASNWTSSLYVQYTDIIIEDLLLFAYNCIGRSYKVTMYSALNHDNTGCTLTCNPSTGAFICSNYRSSSVRQNFPSISDSRQSYYTDFGSGYNICTAIILECGLLDITGISDIKQGDGYYREVYMYPGSHQYAFRRYVNVTTADIYLMEIYQSTENKTLGSYVSTVTSSDPNAYPTNGIHTDGYWYIKQ